MASRMERMKALLCQTLGSELLQQCPDLAYSVNQQLCKVMRMDATLMELYREIDSILFNTVFAVTGGTMRVTLDNGRRVRIAIAFIHDLADYLLALAYPDLPVSPSVQGVLYDFSREGSYGAMRELLRRFPLDEADRAYYTRVLKENGQLA